MKLVIIASILLLIGSRAMSEDLLKARDSTSIDGIKLRASLVKVNNKTITLKREKDGKIFDLSTAQISETDKALIDEAANSIEVIAKSAILSGKFNGLSNSTEEIWELSYRLGRHQLLWKLFTDLKWYGYEYNLVSVTPTKILREKDGQFLIYGENVVIRLLEATDTSLMLIGETLYIARKNIDTKKFILLRIGQPYKSIVPVRYKDFILKCEPEKLGISEHLVITRLVRY